MAKVYISWIWMTFLVFMSRLEVENAIGMCGLTMVKMNNFGYYGIHIYMQYAGRLIDELSFQLCITPYKEYKRNHRQIINNACPCVVTQMRYPRTLGVGAVIKVSDLENNHSIIPYLMINFSPLSITKVKYIPIPSGTSFVLYVWKTPSSLGYYSCYLIKDGISYNRNPINPVGFLPESLDRPMMTLLNENSMIPCGDFVTFTCDFAVPSIETVVYVSYLFPTFYIIDISFTFN